MNHTEHSVTDSRAASTLISVLIMVCLGIQAVISIALLPIQGSVKTTWPFVTYGMYCQVHHEGDVIPKRFVIGVRKDGNQVKITPEDLGWNNWFYRMFADAVLNQDRTVVTSFLSNGPGTRNTQWIALRLIDQSTEFRWTGQLQQPEKELAIMQIEPRREKGQ
jgi:hypothetical protein